MSQKLCQKFQIAESLLCKRWTTLIVEVLLRHPRRFNELLAELEVVSDRMLSERLRELEQAGVVLRRVLPNTPLRVEYSLTPRGQALKPVIDAIRLWGEGHRKDEPHAVAPICSPALEMTAPLTPLALAPQPGLSTPAT